MSVTESHEIDTFDDISPLENVEEEVEDVGGTCNGNRIRFSTWFTGTKIDFIYTPLISDEHNDTNVAIKKSETIPILKQEESDTIIQGNPSLITKETKDKGIESKPNSENNDIKSVTLDISILPAIDNNSVFRLPGGKVERGKSIGKHTQDNHRQPSNMNIHKEHISDDIDMRTKQEVMEAIDLELPINLGDDDDDDFPKLYYFYTKEDDDEIFSSHDQRQMISPMKWI